MVLRREVDYMVYCISDIHGEWDRFKKMLELIQFSEQDKDILLVM